MRAAGLWIKVVVAAEISGSGALLGKMLPVRIIENNKMYAYFR